MKGECSITFISCSCSFSKFYNLEKYPFAQPVYANQVAYLSKTHLAIFGLQHTKTFLPVYPSCACARLHPVPQQLVPYTWGEGWGEGGGRGMAVAGGEEG